MRKLSRAFTAVFLSSLLFSLAACGNATESEATTETEAETAEESVAEESAAEESADEMTAWPEQGNYIDDDGNGLIIFHMTEEDGYEEEGWSVTVITADGDMIGGELQEQADGSLMGEFVTTDDEGNLSEGIATTATLEGEDGVFVQMADGTEYHFVPDPTDYSDMEIGDSLPFFQYGMIYGYDEPDAAASAAYDYLAFDKEQDYDPDHAMVPVVQIVAVDDTDEADSLLYGDYYLFEFEKQDDLLVLVSGGHCPGVIHAERFGEGEGAVYSAFSMDEALTDDEITAVFGDYAEEYQAIASDDAATNAKITQVISDYVKANHLEISGYQLSDGETVALN